MIAGGSADNTRHADIVGVVILDEVLAAGRVSHRRLQPSRRGDHLVVRTRAAGTRIDRDRFTPV